MLKHLNSCTLVMTLCILTGCSSNPYKVKEIDTEVKSTHGQLQGAMIAVDLQGQAIIQKETDAEVQLREQTWKNYDLERDLNYSHEALTQCQNEMADPRLGGSGKVVDIPEIDAVNVTQKKEEFGLNSNGDLKFVTKEMYLDRLKSERRFQEVLTSHLKLVKKEKEKCEREIGYARVKAGLSASRYKSEGVLSADGSFHATRTAENNLDDAFKIAKENK